ncbi:MAG: hypothetical protein ACLGHP_00820 [Vicinamibacteria bacterium]
MSALEALAASHPGSYPVQMALGAALEASSPRDALAAYERAAALLPQATGEDSAHARIAALASTLDDTARAAAAYAQLTAHDPADVASARAWTRLVDPAADPATARIALSRLVGVDPFDADAHSTLGRLQLAAGETEAAVRAFTVALAAGPLDRASAHADLAESLVAAGRPADAKRQTLHALEIAPTYARAQELLLRLVEGSR